METTLCGNPFKWCPLMRFLFRAADEDGLRPYLQALPADERAKRESELAELRQHLSELEQSFFAMEVVQDSALDGAMYRTEMVLDRVLPKDVREQHLDRAYFHVDACSGTRPS